MIHAEFRELFILASFNEQDGFNTHKLKEHLNICPDCRDEYKKMTDFNQGILSIKPEKPDEQLLENARRELRIKLAAASQKNNFIDSVKEFFNLHKLAAIGLALFLLGIISGIALKDISEQPLQGYELLEQSNVKISNINCFASDSADGEVSLEFEAIKPVSIRGKASDPRIQQILAYSLLNKNNDGSRLRAISTIASQIIITTQPGSKIKSALIKTVKYDPNPGVRREALLTLNRLPLEQEIIDVLLYVLENDTNAGNRIAAINSFNPEKINPDVITHESLEILKQKITDDSNHYVKLRAKTVVEEVINNESL